MQIPNDRGIATKKCNGGNAMGITGVGSSYNFIYNTKTGKLSTKDGSKNEFVDFCNGDVLREFEVIANEAGKEVSKYRKI